MRRAGAIGAVVARVFRAIQTTPSRALRSTALSQAAYKSTSASQVATPTRAPDSVASATVPRRTWLSRPRTLVAAGAIGVAAALALNPEEAAVRGNAYLRTARSFSTAAMIIADYKWSLRGMDPTTEEYRRARSRAHQRSADRVLRLCRWNKGIYVKAGQHVASLNYAAPQEYTKTLAVLQDKAPSRPFDEVRAVVLEDLGLAPEVLFRYINPEPIAAASLAQVHEAVTRDGQAVALKVQYPSLREDFESDLWTMRLLADAVLWWFPDVRLHWIVAEFRKNLAQELDFAHEGRNAERVAGYFAHRTDVRVPRIRWDLSSRRVLTMEFLGGVKVNDSAGLVGAGFKPLSVARTLSEVFGDMTFVYGFVHCDPHPGNLNVRWSNAGPDGLDCGGRSRGHMQLVLLDHGLYRELTEEFRVNYCGLWKSLVTMDEGLLRRSSDALGAGKYYDIFPLIFTFRMWNGTSKLGEAMSREDRERLRKQFANTNVGDVMDFLEGLPRDMLLVMRTNNLVRSICKDLGGRSLYRFEILAEKAVVGLHVGRETGRPAGLRDWVGLQWDMARFRVFVALSRVVAWVAQWWWGSTFSPDVDNFRPPG